MPANCAYSFADLYFAAHGTAPTSDDLKNLYDLSQAQRNEVVREWAERAGWVTEDVRGADGTVYASFGPRADTLCKGQEAGRQ